MDFDNGKYIKRSMFLPFIQRAQFPQINNLYALKRETNENTTKEPLETTQSSQSQFMTENILDSTEVSNYYNEDDLEDADNDYSVSERDNDSEKKIDSIISQLKRLGEDIEKDAEKKRTKLELLSFLEKAIKDKKIALKVEAGKYNATSSNYPTQKKEAETLEKELINKVNELNTRLKRLENNPGKLWMNGIPNNDNAKFNPVTPEMFYPPPEYQSQYPVFRYYSPGNYAVPHRLDRSTNFEKEGDSQPSVNCDFPNLCVLKDINKIYCDPNVINTNIPKPIKTPYNRKRVARWMVR